MPASWRGCKYSATVVTRPGSQASLPGAGVPPSILQRPSSRKFWDAVILIYPTRRNRAELEASAKRPAAACKQRAGGFKALCACEAVAAARRRLHVVFRSHSGSNVMQNLPLMQHQGVQGKRPNKCDLKPESSPATASWLPKLWTVMPAAFQMSSHSDWRSSLAMRKLCKHYLARPRPPYARIQ